MSFRPQDDTASGSHQRAASKSLWVALVPSTQRLVPLATSVELMIRLLDYTAAFPALDLAIDEALLGAAERQGSTCDQLRLWESVTPAVILGRSSRVAMEALPDACHEQGIPILRRTSGGCAIVAGPGCLMYSLVLCLERRPELRSIDEAHRFVLGQLAAALGSRVAGVHRAGTSDLVIERGGRALKFSGNSLRVRRTHLLYHGTLLHRFPLDLAASCLAAPPREPEYRAGRSHGEFLTNLPLAEEELRGLVACAFGASGVADLPPLALAEQLLLEKYSQHEWNFRL